MSADLAIMRRRLGHGRHRVINGDSLWASLELSEWRGPFVSDANQHTELGRALKFSTPCGDVWLENPSFLTTLSGIPFESNADSADGPLRDLAIACLPAGWLAGWGGAWLLDSSPANSAVQLVSFLIEIVDTHSIRHATLVRMSPSTVSSMLDFACWEPVNPYAAATELVRALPVSIPCCVGTTRIFAHTLDKLRTGDVIIIQMPNFDAGGSGVLWLGALRMRVRQCDDLPASFEFRHWDRASSSTAAENENELVPHASSLRETMKGTIDSSIHDGDEPDNERDGLPRVDSDARQLSDIPLTLFFVAGTLRTTVGELHEMAPGHVMDLRENVEGQIAIEANGMVIGFGELVEVDGRLAVELKQMRLRS
ncbi:FliM/FliN family flagellar motor switch protein [Burkholderia territorii]|uniref:FliM/FliN family flagellar motor switch protein n=1 Tax=Burkholderia territorii TaxID=1503055 RepID=UPI0018C7F661|nr:FliM/FliN family flagellar motor switch protein [Burkholderia territorii]